MADPKDPSTPSPTLTVTSGTPIVINVVSASTEFEAKERIAGTSLPKVVNVNASEFRRALARLASDPAYRERAMNDPSVITADYKMTLKDLQSLREVAVMSGADVTEVNKLRAQSLSAVAFGNIATLGPGASEVLKNPGNIAADVNVSCCSCCCCCCGETAGGPMMMTSA